MEDKQIESKVSVVFYLPEEISFAIRKTKKETGVHYSRLEGSNPHFTVYSCRFDRTKYPELVSRLKNMNISPFTVTIGEIEFAQHPKNKKTFVSFGLGNKEKLQELQEHVLAIANPLRGDLVREIDRERYDNGVFSDQEYAVIQKYGYQYVQEYFDPHVTVGEVDMRNTETVEMLKQGLSTIAGIDILIDSIVVKIKDRTLPDRELVYESELTTIPLISPYRPA